MNVFETGINDVSVLPVL